MNASFITKTVACMLSDCETSADLLIPSSAPVEENCRTHAVFLKFLQSKAEKGLGDAIKNHTSSKLLLACKAFTFVLNAVGCKLHNCLW